MLTWGMEEKKPQSFHQVTLGCSCSASVGTSVGLKTWLCQLINNHGFRDLAKLFKSIEAVDKRAVAPHRQA